MARIPEQVRKAIFTVLNASSAVTTHVSTRIYADQAPAATVAGTETAYPYVVYTRGVPGTVTYALDDTVTLEDDLWAIAAYTTEDDSSTYSPAELGSTIVGACEYAIGNTLTLSAGTLAYCAKFSYMPPTVANVGDRVVWKHGLILRVGAH